MKHALSILALMIGCQSAFAANGYSDSALARNQALSPFDRSFEAGRAQSINQPVDFQQTTTNKALQIDLSTDDPVASIKETDTERTFRQTLQDLDKRKQDLNAARVESERQLQVAKDAAESAAAKRRTDLLAQQAEIRHTLDLNQQAQQATEQAKLKQVADIERQLQVAKETAENAAAKRRQDLLAQQTEIRHALELSQKAQQSADQVKLEQVADIATIKAHSDQLLMLAENNAEVIESSAHKRVILERIDPSVVMNESVPVRYQGATLKEIVQGIMPVGWEVKVDFSKRPELETRRYEFISTEARDLALRHLASSVQDARVRFMYFWDLKDAQGNPTPMILLTDHQK